MTGGGGSDGGIYAESPDIVYTTGSTSFSFNHGLGTVPRRFGAYAKFISASSGHAVGDRVALASQDGDGGRHSAISANETSVTFRADSGSIFRTLNGSTVGVNNAAVRLVLWAESATGSSSQWVSTGNNISYSSGNVGIALSVPHFTSV